MSKLTNGVVSRHQVLVEFQDQYGEVRVVHRNKGTKLSIKRLGNTPVHALNRAAAVLIGQRIRTERIKKEMTMADLCIKAGLASASPKQRIYELEVGSRNEGMRFGTLYAIALALDVDVWALLPGPKEVADAAKVASSTVTALKVSP